MQVEFLSHPIPPHQLLVHMFDRQRTLGAPLVVTLDDGKTTPDEKEDKILEFYLLSQPPPFSGEQYAAACVVMEINAPAQLNHLCVVILEVVLPADADAVGGHG